MTLVFPLLFFMYASRILGADGIGKVEFGKNITGYFSLLASLGINNYGIREGAKLRNSRMDFSRFVHEILCINCVSMLVAIILFLLVALNVSALSDYKTILFVFSTTIVFTPMGVEWVYGALEEYKYIAIRTIVFQIVALIVLFLFVRDSGDYIWYAVVLIVSGVGSNVINLIHLWKFVDFKFVGSYRIKRHLHSILLLFALAVSNTLYSYIDTTMIGFINGDKEVGLYTAALKVNRVVVNVLGAIGAVAMPRLSYLWDQNNKDDFYRIIKLIVNILLMLSVPSCIGMLCLSKTVLFVFCGSDFIKADLTMRILSLIIIILSLSTFLNMHILIPVNKEKYTFLAIIGGVITNVGINAFLIPRFAGNGAAIGTVIGETVVLIIAFYYADRVVKMKSLFGKIYQYVLASLPIIIITCFFTHCINNLLAQCVWSIVVSVCTYFTILFLLKNETVIYIYNLILEKIHKETVK